MPHLNPATLFAEPGPRLAAEPAAHLHSLLEELLWSSLIPGEDWELLPEEVRRQLSQCSDPKALLPLLMQHRLLTDYQAARIEAGKRVGLVLGNYRVLDRLGAGGMGVVFKAEHVTMRRPVAIKVVPVVQETDSCLVRRFATETRIVAQLQHPNIVAALDAGKIASPDPDAPWLHYFVMEYVPGQDLEEYVQTQGPFAPAQTCDLGHQIASALAEAHQHHLVHRDIKPSNIRLTPEGRAKLLDFGLACDGHRRMTQPGALLGTLDYMAPEQVSDAGAVDIRADLYGLGGTLFWCLTGRAPFLPKDNLAQEVAARLIQAPPSVRAVRPEVPEALDAIVARMMALRPDDRYATPQEVMQALLPFLKPGLRDPFVLRVGPLALSPASERADQGRGLPVSLLPNTVVHHILIADDEPHLRQFVRFVLQSDGIECDEVANGRHALEAVGAKCYDLVLLDIDMPEVTGWEVCRQLREKPPCPNLKIVMFSGRATADELAQMLLAGADDYLTKPFGSTQLQARVKAALRLKDAQDRSDRLNQHLWAINQELERNLTARDSDLVHARNALVLALAKLVEYRDSETGAHLMRLQRYSRELAEAAALTPGFAGQIDAHFIELLECCAPLHDIGKVGLPDHILLKPGKLEPDERIIMQTHTIIGADTLRAVAKQHGFAQAFLHMAADIARHHHERYDGTGYPDRLAGSDIPLAARLVALGDVYDALRSRRVYKPALSHTATMQVMTGVSAGQFDPALLRVFHSCAPRFERIYRDMAD